MDRIFVDYRVKKRIMEEINTTHNSVQLALLGARDTDLARRIREKALELGGIEVKNNK